MYGDEALGIPPDALYGKEEANQASIETEEVFTACARLVARGR